jgi:hypothetical protein
MFSNFYDTECQIPILLDMQMCHQCFAMSVPHSYQVAYEVWIYMLPKNGSVLLLGRFEDCKVWSQIIKF